MTAIPQLRKPSPFLAHLLPDSRTLMVLFCLLHQQFGPVRPATEVLYDLCLLLYCYYYTVFFMWKKVKMKSLSRVLLFVTPWTVAYQAPPSMGFSRQECWSGLPFPSPGDLPDPGIEPGSPTLQADALPSEPRGKPFLYVHWGLFFRDSKF